MNFITEAEMLDKEKTRVIGLRQWNGGVDVVTVAEDGNDQWTLLTITKDGKINRALHIVPEDNDFTVDSRGRLKLDEDDPEDIKAKQEAEPANISPGTPLKHTKVYYKDDSYLTFEKGDDDTIYVVLIDRDGQYRNGPYIMAFHNDGTAHRCAHINNQVFQRDSKRRIKLTNEDLH